jgi:hypothetical protein
VCPDEATLRAVLHAFGTDTAALQDACAVARTGSLAVLRLLVTPGQRQACCGPTAVQQDAPSPPQETRRDAAPPSA